MKILTAEQLKKKSYIELIKLAEDLGIKNAKKLTEEELTIKLFGKAVDEIKIEDTEFQTKDFAEYDEETIKTLGIKKGQRLNIVEFASGKELKFKQYEVYTEKGLKEAMDDMFGNGVMEPSLFNYLLMRFAKENDTRKHVVKFGIYAPDEDSVFYSSLPNYTLSLYGTFKDGTFEGSVHDSLIKYLTDDDIDY